MPRNKEQLKKIFFENASPEERLAWEKKQLEKKLTALEEMPPEVIKGDRGDKGEKGEQGEPGSLIEGEEIVVKINELEVVPIKQIDAKHIKNWPRFGQKTNVENWGGLQTGLWLNGALTTNSKLTVSLTAPTNPAVNDLWYDLN